jgi:hypothetical protein
MNFYAMDVKLKCSNSDKFLPLIMDIQVFMLPFSPSTFCMQEKKMKCLIPACVSIVFHQVLGVLLNQHQSRSALQTLFKDVTFLYEDTLLSV